MSEPRTNPGAVHHSFELHAGAVYNLAFQLTADRAEAEDLLQEAFLALLRQSQPPLEARAWLCTVVLNKVRDRARRQRPGQSGEPGSLADPEPGPPLEVEHQERGAAVAAALARLPLAQREVVVLHVFEGMSFHAIGTVCGIPADTAASRWRYACERLRQTLHRDWSTGERR